MMINKDDLMSQEVFNELVEEVLEVGRLYDQLGNAFSNVESEKIPISKLENIQYIDDVVMNDIDIPILKVLNELKDLRKFLKQGIEYFQV